MFLFGVIPARGGSKGLPGKNLRELGGKPLIAWTIEAARGSRLLSRTIVSTDDPAIAEAARSFGAEVPFLRPPELARDDSDMLGALQHAVRWLESSQGVRPDLVVLLQPTSPLRGAREIDECARLVLETGADSAQTVAQDRRHPWHRFLLKDGRLSPLFPEAEGFSRRQEAPPVYFPTGAVYAVRTATLMKENSLRGGDHRGLVTSIESSVDIDEAWDLRLAETILGQGNLQHA